MQRCESVLATTKGSGSVFTCEETKGLGRVDGLPEVTLYVGGSGVT